MRPTILEEAGKLVDGEREKTYGHPMQNFYDISKMWSAILRTEVSPEQTALCMIAVKIARQMNNRKRDNLVDIAGYARTIEKLQDFSDRETGG